MKGILRRLPLARTAAWSLRAALFVVVIASLLPFAARSGPVSRLVAARVGEAISSRTGREVRLGSAHLEIFPASVRIRGLDLSGADRSFDPPLLAVRDASAIFSLRTLLKGEILVDAVEIDGITLDWGGEPGPVAGPGGRLESRGRPIELRRLNVRNGEIRWAGRGGTFRLEAEEVEATAASIPCATNLCVGGTARAGRLDLSLDDHRMRGDAVALQFEYADGQLEVPRFKITGAGLEVSGRAGWKGGPPSSGDVTARIAAVGDALDPMAGGFPVKADALEAGLTLTLRAGVIALTGRGQVRNATCFEDIRARSAGMTFKYEEGIFTAEVDAEGVLPDTDWIHPAGGGPLQASLRVDPHGIGSMVLTSGPFLYRDVLSLIDPRLPRADLLARATGELRWRSDERGSLEGSLEVVADPAAPGSPQRGEAGEAGMQAASGMGDGGEGALPAGRAEAGGRPVVSVRATARVGLEAGRIQLTDGHIIAPGLEAGLSGWILTDRKEVHLEIPIARIDLDPTLRSLVLLPAADLALAQELSGTAAGQVQVNLRSSAAVIRGSLSGTDLSLRRSSTPVDILRADVPFVASGGKVSFDGLRLSGAGWTVAGDLGLDTAFEWPLRRANLRFQEMPGSPLWEAVALDAMAGGVLTGSAVFDLDDPEIAGSEGRFDLHMSGARLAGIELTETHLSATESRGNILIDRLAIVSGAGQASATGSWRPESGAGELEITADDLQLRDLLAAWAPGREGDEGLLTIEGRASLRPGGIEFSGAGHATGLTTAGLPIGVVLAQRIEYSAGEGATGLEMDVAAPSLGTTGLVRLGPGEDAPLTLALTARDMDLARLRPLLSEAILPGLGGRADLTLEGTIPTSDPWSAALDARLHKLSLEVAGLSFSMVGEPSMRLRGGKIEFDETRLVGEGTDLSLAGIYNLRSGSAGTGRISGTFDAGLLALSLPQLDARGTAGVDLEISAEGDHIEYRGRLTASGVRLDYPGSPSPVENLTLSVAVDPTGKIEASGIAFDFAGGKVTGSGAGRLEGLRIAEVEIRLSGTSLSTEPIPALDVLYDAEAVITAKGPRVNLAGRMNVVRAVYRKEFGLQAGGALGGRRVVPNEQARRGGPDFTLDIDILAPDGVLVRNESAQLEGSAILKVTGTLSRPELTGRIGLFEGGTFRFREVTYRSAGGGILFDDPDVIDPLLNFTAIADVREYTITLSVLGRYSKPRFELSSEPALSQRDIVSLLVTGETQETNGGTDAGAGLVAEENVALYLTAPLSETLTSTVGRALGLTTVQLAPQFVSGSADPTARLTLTKRVSPRLFFTYSDDLGSGQDEIYQFEYDLSRAWQLIGLRDSDGSVSGNLRFRHYWGGPPRSASALSSRGSTAAVRREVSRVQFEGSPLGDESTLRKQAGIQPGRLYSRADVLEGREELRQWLAGEGYPLASIRVEEIEREKEDGTNVVDLKYIVDPGEEVRLEISGLRKQGAYERAVQEEWLRGTHVENLASTGQEVLEQRLGSRGYAAAEVSTQVIEEAGKVRVHYEVDQGPKVSVQSIRFTGTGSVPAEEIERAMGTREDRWDSSGTLLTSVLAEDLDAIRAVYLSHGYLDVFVGDPVVTFSDDRRTASIEIPVREGASWRAGEVVIEGAASYPAGGLAEATLIEPGMLLRPSVIQSAEERVRDLLDANGYHTVRVQSRVDGEPERARVVFVIEEGPRQIVERVYIRGNERTADRVIEREIHLLPGDPLSRNSLIEIQRKLYALGLFRSVDVRAETLPESPGRATVVVRVVEGDPIVTGFGVGYDTEEQLQGLVHVGHSNVFGTGRAVSLLARGSGVNRRVQASLSDRRLLGVPFEGSLTASWEEEERQSFDVRRTGVGIQFRKKLTQRLTALGRYELADVDLLSVEIDPATPLDDEDQEILDEAVRLGHAGGSLARDTRDDIVAPTRGSYATGDLGMYSQAFGSQDTFAKLYLRGSRFFATRGGIVFGLAARVGHEEPFGSTQAVPLTARFFSGGDNTLRGFKLDEAGPLDFTSEEPVGGEFQLLLNGEMRFPIFRALKGVLFYDVGNTFFSLQDFRAGGTEILTTEVAREGDCAYNLDPNTNPNVNPNESTCPFAIQDGLRHTLGAGLRLDTPVGPIRLEVGRKMDRRFGREEFDLGQGFSVDKGREETLYEIFLSIGSAF